MLIFREASFCRWQLPKPYSNKDHSYLLKTRDDESLSQNLAYKKDETAQPNSVGQKAVNQNRRAVHINTFVKCNSLWYSVPRYPTLDAPKN